MRSALECEMSRSCQSATFSSPTPAAARTTRASPEMRSATTLRRSGWTPELFPKGARVTIKGAPDRREPTACYVSTLVFPDGSTLDRYGQRTPPTRVEAGPRQTRLANGDLNLAGLWAAEQLVMADPRGVDGALVPLSEALANGDDPADDAPGRQPGASLMSPEAASRLFTARIQLTEAGQAAATAFANEPNPAMRCEPIGIVMDWSYDSPVNRITQDEPVRLIGNGLGLREEAHDNTQRLVHAVALLEGINA